MTSLLVEAFGVTVGVVWFWWSFVRLGFWVMDRYPTWKKRSRAFCHWAMFRIASLTRMALTRSKKTPPTGGPYR